MSAWKAHDINAVLSLFADDVEYWETPFTKLANLDEVRAEWMNILNQQNIDIHCIVYSQDDEKFTIQWELHYSDSHGNLKQFKGVYLVTMDSNGKCTYFFHCGESKT